MTLTRSTKFTAAGFSLLYLASILFYHLPLSFVYDLGGYYNHLTRGFAEGQLHISIAPSKEILAAPNPQAPDVPMEWKMHDMALYKGRYYLYHGAAPVLLVFGPWRMLTGFDLPEAIAGWIFLSAGVTALLVLAAPLNIWKCLAVGLSSGALLLTPRILVYEIAISCGFACLAWAFVMRQEKQDWWAGALLGLALLSRPHLVLAIVFFRWRSWVGVALAGCVMAAYNYARFDSPFELGLTYLLSGPNQQVPVPSVGKFFGALYMLLFQAPSFTAWWPFFEGRWDAWFATPENLYHEPLVGALFFAPFLAFLAGARREFLLTGCLVLGFVSFTGWVTQRYLLDFLPWLVLAVLPKAESSRWGRVAIAAGAALSLLDILRW